MVTAKVNAQELLSLDKLIREKGVCPNQVSDVYKLRRGRFNDVRIWSEMDLGTCRIKDLFMTDVDFKPVPDFYPMNIVFEDCDDDIMSVLQFLNQEERKEETEIIKEKQDNSQEMINLESINKSNPMNWKL